MSSFQKGDIVTYHDDQKRKRYGRITRVTKKSITVDDGWHKNKMAQENLEMYQRWEG